jgi:hypothetical protein
MVGEARPSPAYYIALGLLVVGLVTGLSLFLLLATRHHSTGASIDVSSLPTTCPPGTRAPTCYSFTVTNASGKAVFASCTLVSEQGTHAMFEDKGTVENFTLVGEGIKVLLVTVAADPGSSTAPPSMSCPATPA